MSIQEKLQISIKALVGSLHDMRFQIKEYFEKSTNNLEEDWSFFFSLPLIVGNTTPFLHSFQDVSPDTDMAIWEIMRPDRGSIVSVFDIVSTMEDWLKTEEDPNNVTFTQNDIDAVKRECMRNNIMQITYDW